MEPPKKKKRPNRAEQRAARQLAAARGLTYQQALQLLRNKVQELRARDAQAADATAASAAENTDEPTS